jgi:threonine dehydratase
MTMGAATCGAEFVAEHPDLEIIIVPVGGGGLIGGIAAAAKLLKPDIQVIGVEPLGANAMFQSLAARKPLRLDNAFSIADSLAAPVTLPYSFGVVQTYVDRIVHVQEHTLRDAMKIYNEVLGLTVEPACAAALAGLIGPLKDDAIGKNVGLIACGSNIGLTRYQDLMNGD